MNMERNTEYIDIHNHSTWSDGEDILESVIDNAARCDISLVGVCDHYGLSGARSISPSGLDEYVQAVQTVGLACAKRVKVLCGVEIPMRLLLKGLTPAHAEGFSQLDFLLIEDLDYTKNADALPTLKDELGKLNCKAGLAHCNLPRVCENLGCSLDELAAWMAEVGLFWEVNAASQYACFDDVIGYDRHQSSEVKGLFEALNRHGVCAVAGSDCHAVDGYEAGRLKEANRTIRKYLIPYTL